MSLTVTDRIQEIDRELSKRPLALDPGGYFIIYLEQEKDLICAKHFTNVINDQGLAVDPATGKVIPAKGKVARESTTLFQGHTAKQVCVEIFERDDICPVTLIDHAAYLGRELQRAEWSLVNHQEYIQD